VRVHVLFEVYGQSACLCWWQLWRLWGSQGSVIACVRLGEFAWVWDCPFADRGLEQHRRKGRLAATASRPAVPLTVGSLCNECVYSPGGISGSSVGPPRKMYVWVRVIYKLLGGVRVGEGSELVLELREPGRLSSACE
jgi:hypothetical protein